MSGWPVPKPEVCLRHGSERFPQVMATSSDWSGATRYRPLTNATFDPALSGAARGPIQQRGCHA